MNGTQIFSPNRILAAAILSLHLIPAAASAQAEPRERDIRIPRVPADELPRVKKLVNPIPPTASALREAKELFSRSCAACHGAEGKGDGPVAVDNRIDPKPRNFTNPEFQRLRTDGELYWVLTHGSHDTEMMRMDFFFTEEELWKLILYVRSLGGADP